MPVIEHYPGTAIIFVGSLLTIVFGVLNLIARGLVASLDASKVPSSVGRRRW